jgi:hypothetical protein
MADCCKGEKYGKGLLIYSGEGIEEQGYNKEQEENFNDYNGVNEEFVTKDDSSSLMVRKEGVLYTLKNGGGRRAVAQSFQYEMHGLGQGMQTYY